MVLPALSHAAMSLLVSLIGWYFGHLGIGIAAALGFYLGREVAQHERKTPGTDPFRGFYVWNWSMDGRLDILFPVLVCGALYLSQFALK